DCGLGTGRDYLARPQWRIASRTDSRGLARHPGHDGLAGGGRGTMERKAISTHFRNALTRLVLGANLPRQVSPPLGPLLVQRVRRNLGLRAIALLLAIGLWFFVNAGQRGVLAPMRVPISYRQLPAGLVIVNQRPEFVQIEVRGPRTLLSLLDPDRMLLRLDLSGVTLGQAVFKIGPEMF